MATASVRQAVEEARSNLSAPNPAGHSQFIKDPLAHFKSMPWCAELLSDPMILETVVPDRRTLPSGQYNFVRRVMSGATTVRACVSFVQRLQQQQSGAGGDGERVEGKAVSASKPLLQGGGPADGEDARNPFLLFNALLDLGEDLCSYPNTLHGGLFVVLMDEVMSTAANIQTKHGAHTVLFNTTFRKAVKTPQVVLVRGRVVKRDGRKITVRGSIEDKDGKVLGEGEGVWVGAGKQLRSHL